MNENFLFNNNINKIVIGIILISIIFFIIYKFNKNGEKCEEEGKNEEEELCNN